MRWQLWVPQGKTFFLQEIFLRGWVILELKIEVVEWIGAIDDPDKAVLIILMEAKLGLG